MKNCLHFLIALILATSCKTIDLQSYTRPPIMAVDVKFLPLDKREFGNSKIEMDMVDQNICETLGPKYGYIHLSTYLYNNSEWDFPFKLLSLFSLGSSGFLGLPYTIQLAEIRIRYEIRNSRDDEIAFFEGEGKARVPCALYYGYNLNTANLKAITDASNQARKEIMRQLSKDVVENINQKLKAIGPIK